MTNCGALSPISGTPCGKPQHLPNDRGHDGHDPAGRPVSWLDREPREYSTWEVAKANPYAWRGAETSDERDTIKAKLSDGECWVSSDVVDHYGREFFANLGGIPVENVHPVENPRTLGA